MKKATMIGCGRWGSFIAWYLDRQGLETSLYGRKASPHMQEFLERGTNGIISLPLSVHLVHDLDQLVDQDLIAISIPSQRVYDLAEELASYGLKNKIFLLNMKGIDIQRGLRLSQIMEEKLAGNQVAVWLGPGHPQELVQGIPNCMVIDSKEDQVKDLLIRRLSSPLIRFYYGQDLLGNEIGAAYKNIIGIAAGLLDGLGQSSLKGALMSRGCREVSRLIQALGGDPRSAYGLCHLGDYEATVFSPFSNNRMFGEKFARQEAFDKLAEGYYTCQAVNKMAQERGLDLPINQALYQILYQAKDPREALDDLFLRSLKKEF